MVFYIEPLAHRPPIFPVVKLYRYTFPNKQLGLESLEDLEASKVVVAVAQETLAAAAGNGWAASFAASKSQGILVIGWMPQLVHTQL